MYGSSASNEYGNGGTVKATGFSSRVRFESELFAVPARKRPGAAVPAPSNPAPTIPVFNKKLRRFMETSAARRANRTAGWIIPLVPAGWQRGLCKPRFRGSRRIAGQAYGCLSHQQLFTPALIGCAKVPIGQIRRGPDPPKL